jgi:hypothetical protein
MKYSKSRVIAVALTGLFLLGNVPAHASEERGAWVAVDANGNAVSQAIVCTPSVCGNKEILKSTEYQSKNCMTPVHKVSCIQDEI